jgi:hypothetical protein
MKKNEEFRSSPSLRFIINIFQNPTFKLNTLNSIHFNHIITRTGKWENRRYKKITNSIV